MLYKKKYTIGVYSSATDGETLLALCESVLEFADFLDTDENTAWVILHRLFNGKQRKIIVNSRMCTVEFIKL